MLGLPMFYSISGCKFHFQMPLKCMANRSQRLKKTFRKSKHFEVNKIIFIVNIFQILPPLVHLKTRPMEFTQIANGLSDLLIRQITFPRLLLSDRQPHKLQNAFTFLYTNDKMSLKLQHKWILVAINHSVFANKCVLTLRLGLCSCFH